VADPPVIERLLKRDRTITLAGLVVICAIAWTYLFAGAGMGMRPGTWLLPPAQPSAAASPTAGMEMADMDMGVAAPSSPRAWSLGLATLTLAMWWTMMIAMMTPAAAPTILLYARVHRHAQGQAQAQRALAPTGAFAAGYLLVWLAFSLVAAGLQLGLQRSGLVSSLTLSSQSRWLTGGALIAAGLYQLSPLQQACLGHCRAPGAFLARHWRPGAGGAVRLGVLHGAYCVGCCWLLMALLFVGGVMNLVWIAALAILVLGEKLLPGGVWIGRIAGAVLIAGGLATWLS